MGLLIFVVSCAVASLLGYAVYRKVRAKQMEGYVDEETE